MLEIEKNKQIKYLENKVREKESQIKNENEQWLSKVTQIERRNAADLDRLKGELSQEKEQQQQ